MPTYESDICIIGGGISAALTAEKISEARPGATIVVVEAGNKIFDFENRNKYRRRQLEYGENGWPGDFIADQSAENIISRSMAVGGSALHWGGVCNRFSEEDLRLKSMYGLAVDWPLSWTELENYYCEAEQRIGVAGEPSPHPQDRRSQPYPLPPMPLTYNLVQLKAWAEKSGLPFFGTPVAKNTLPYGGRNQCMRCNTCSICPTGARYSPDFTFKQLLAEKKIRLHDRTLVRKLIPHDKTTSVAAAQAVHRDRPDDPVEYRARHFVVASGYAWSPHLLLLSTSSRFPNGMANSSGLVGRYMTGHAYVSVRLELNTKLYPGMNDSHSLISREFFRCRPDGPYVRHDLRVWDSEEGREPRIKDDNGCILMGDDLLSDWRARAAKGAARLRAYYDVHPSRDSRLTLDPSHRNTWGDPLPKIDHRLDDATLARQDATKQHIIEAFQRLCRADEGKILSTEYSRYLDHPAGGCRMGADPATSVCDSHGRTHDHENLWIVGSPTQPTGGCTNGTITFAALTLRSASKLADVLGASRSA